jgi:hypothetical protein
MHTRQDRRIKKEMAFTHKKNATKPNSSKIIKLQATRKDHLDDLRNLGESSCNPEDGTDQSVQSLAFMMMIFLCSFFVFLEW